MSPSTISKSFSKLKQIWIKKNDKNANYVGATEAQKDQPTTVEDQRGPLPIEIWRAILQYACATPFSPFVDDYHNYLSQSITQNFDLFRIEFAPRRQYREGDAILKKLRLVCRLWTQIIDSIPNRYIFTNSGDFTYPSCHLNRPSLIEVVHLSMIGPNSFYCFCPSNHEVCRGKRCITALTRPRDQEWWKKPDDDLQGMLHNVKVVFLRGPSPSSDRFLRVASNTRALYYSNLSHSRRITFLPEMKNLTHLSLNQINCLQFLEGHVDRLVVVPFVEYLELFFIRVPTSTRWILPGDQKRPPVFPKLKTLKIDGDIEHDFEDIIQNFLIECGHQIVEFVEYSNYSTSALRGIPKMLPNLPLYFPNLRLYGTLLDELISHSTSTGDLTYAPDGPSFTLLLYDFFEKFLQKSDEATRQLCTLLNQYRFTRIMTKNYWEDLKAFLDKIPTQRYRRECLSSLRVLFKHLGPSIEFVDREGITLHRASSLDENIKLALAGGR
ncbi:hypothetical protein CPB86DRAFT_872483 [Serendipita vermifera]|nr:hypothetical protein CPB86DRAFT_872483 [Serendipita vermifera]